MQIAKLNCVNGNQQFIANGGRDENHARAGWQLPRLRADQRHDGEIALAFEERQRFKNFVFMPFVMLGGNRCVGAVCGHKSDRAFLLDEIMR